MRNVEIKKVYVEWNERISNAPELHAVIEGDVFKELLMFGECPHRVLHNYGFGDRGGILYLATFEQWAHYVIVKDPPQAHRGGCTGMLLLERDIQFNVKDGWSSRASVVNQFLPEEDHIVEITLHGIHQDGSSVRWGISIRVDAVRALLPEGAFLVRAMHDPEPSYRVSASRHSVVKPQRSPTRS